MNQESLEQIVARLEKKNKEQGGLTRQEWKQLKGALMVLGKISTGIEHDSRNE